MVRINTANGYVERTWKFEVYWGNLTILLSETEKNLHERRGKIAYEIMAHLEWN